MFIFVAKIFLAIIILLAIFIACVVIYFQFYDRRQSGYSILGGSNTYTLGKVDRTDIQICDGPELKRTFPDLDYAMFGYNSIFGYPLATGHDPGLTHPIFVSDYTVRRYTSDCRFHVPKGFILVPDIACVTSFTSDTVKDSSSFENSMSASAEVSGGGWGVSFSASAEYKKKTSQMASSESVFIFSTAKCNYYFAKMDEYDPPALNKQFLQAAKGLKTDTDLFRFFDYYGTHYLTYTLFGARFVYEHKMKKSDFQSESNEDTSVSVKASYSGLFSLSGGFGMSKSSQEKASKFQEKVETKTISIGSPPPSDGNTMTWASTVKDNPVPVQYKMQSIEGLFTEKFMEGTGLDYKKLYKMISDGKRKYCDYLRNMNAIDTCDLINMQVVKFGGLYMTGGVPFKLSEARCKDMCSNEQLCFAIHMWDSRCWIYRKRKNTTFLTSNETVNTSAIEQHAETIEIKQKKTSSVTIFIENMRLMEMAFKLKHARMTPALPVRAKFVVNSEKECANSCLTDRLCAAYSRHLQAAEKAYNCFIYNVDKVIENIVQKQDDYETVFMFIG